MNKYYLSLCLALAILMSPNSRAWALDAASCSLLLRNMNGDLNWYETIRDMSLQPSKDLNQFSPAQGIFVTKRNEKGEPVEAFIRVLADNDNDSLEVIGDFNNWGANGTVKLHPDSYDRHYFTGTLTNIFHGMQYRLLLNGKSVLDPASLAYSSPELNQRLSGNSNPYLNSVFWDIDGVGKPKTPAAPVDLRGSPVVATEIDVWDLAEKWNYNGHVGPRNKNETYKFIAESGLVDHLKDWGINAVELLPFNASVDGDVWSYRYLVYGLFAIDSHLGTPTEFAEMVNAFNRAGISIIMDSVVGHYPPTGNLGIRELSDIGLQSWKKSDGQNLYGQLGTEWSTRRYDYQNPYVRRFLIDSIINMIKYFHIGGIRIDNFGGIAYVPGGNDFLRELNEAIKAYCPQVFISSEMFGGYNRVTKRLDWDGMGADVHNNGDFFDFIFRNAQKRTDEINMDWVRGLLRNPWGWKELAVFNYITDHDEAANNRGQASGAYFASLVNGGGWQYVEGKTRVFAALAMLSGSYYIDMPQLRLLQEGSFYSNPAVDYSLEQYDSQRHMAQFFADMSKYFVSHRAFAFSNMHANLENHTDYNNKVVSIERIDMVTGKRIFAVLNLGDHGLSNYRFGVDTAGTYRLALDSDASKYGGRNWLANGVPDGKVSTDAIGEHGKAQSIRIPYLAPYGVAIFEQE